MRKNLKTIYGLFLVILICHSGFLYAQEQRKITGRVFDANNELLIGVSVVEVGTSNGVTTDQNGSYTILLTAKGTELKFSYLGYKDQVQGVGNRRIIDVRLQENISDLDEVTVVGYGFQKKASVVGAIATIQPDRLGLTPSRSLSNNLAGQISGVIAVQRSGNPWYNNSDFWIRGVSTFLNAQGPMVLIDGVERSLHDIDPEEVESFSVLKDAAASAVYGVRGANGVIMINTKRGAISPPKVEVKYESAFVAPVKIPSYIGSVKYIELMNEMMADENPGSYLYDEATIQKYRDQSDPDLYPDVNWWKVLTKDFALSDKVNMNVNGGNNLLRYAMELGYYGESGILKNDPKQAWDSSLKVKRYTARTNVDINLSKTTLLRVNLGGFLQTKNGPPEYGGDETNVGLFFQASRVPPYIHPPIYSDGRIPRIFAKENPWAWATQRGFQRTNISTIQSTTSLEQDLKFITPGLSAKATFAFDRFSGAYVVRDKTPDYYNTASGRDENGQLITSLQTTGQEFLAYSYQDFRGNQSIYFEGMLNYSRMFNKVHDVNAMLLYNQKEYDDYSKWVFRTQGFAGRLSYSYLRKYVAEFNFGYNGSENFAQGFRFGFFPAVAVGWVASEEDFMNSIRETFSLIKLRASMGQAGNSDIGGRRFAYQTTIENTGQYWYGENATVWRLGRAEGDIGIDNLTWETVTKTNLGLDLGLWNAINLTVDVFKDKRKNILMPRSNTPASAGFLRLPYANFGKVDNKGIDLSLTVSKQINSDWYLSALGNFTYAHNTIVEYDEPASILGTTRAHTGHPVGQIFGLISDGLYTKDDFDANGELKSGLPIPANPLGLRPGDIKYRDLTGDGFVTADDQTAIGGTEMPEIVYGFGLNARYKLIDFGIFFQGVGNTWRMLGGENWLPGNTLGAGNIYTNVDDRWTEENPSQNVFWPRLSRKALANNALPSTWWLRDMSFLRLKSIELGVTLSRNWIKKLGIANMRFFVRGSNLFTFSSFKLWDPELATPDGLKYPIMKSASGGFSINFQ